MRNQKKGILFGFVLALVLMCGVNALFSPGAAANADKNAKLSYRDIKICIDGQVITPKDANGKVVEPFIYDGTTYLPVRAVGAALGKAVDYDGKTHTVYLGAKPAGGVQPSTANDSARFVGQWTTQVDMADILNARLAADPSIAELAEYLKVDSYVLTLNFTFNSNGTYQIAIDRAALSTTTDELIKTLSAGTLKYFEDFLAAQAAEYGITVKDFLTASGVSSVKEFLVKNGADPDKLFDKDQLVAAFDQVESSGAYTAKDGVLRMVDSADNSIDLEFYQFISGTQVKLLDQTGDSELGDLILNKK